MANHQSFRNFNIFLNLATEPRRNRRLFWLQFILMVIILVAGLIGLVLVNWSSLSELKKLKSSNQVMSEKKIALSAENRELNQKVETLRKKHQPLVEEINGLLEKKAFSWVRFFSRLEEALLPQSFLISLSPAGAVSVSGAEFRVRIGLTGRDDLTNLVKNFQLQGFSEIKILNEAFQDSKFQVEMSFRYAETK